MTDNTNQDGLSFGDLDMDSLLGSSLHEPGGEGQGSKGNGTTPPANPATPETKTTEPAALPAIPKEVIEAHLKAKGIEKTLPDTLTLEDLAEAIGAKAGPKLHPQALAIQKALEQGQTLEQYIEQRAAPQRMIKLSDEELFTAALRQRFGKRDDNPDGWSDEKVAEVVSSKKNTGDLALQAEQIRMALRDQVKKQQEQDLLAAQEIEKPVEAPNLSDPKVLKDFKEAIAASSKEVIKDNKLFGIDMGDLVKPDELANRLETLLMPDPKTGMSITETRLQGNNAWARMALVMDLLESGALASLLKGNAEQAKKDLLNQLELTPNASGGGGRAKDGAIDLDRLISPAPLVPGR